METSVKEVVELTAVHQPINDTLVVFDSITGYFNDEEFVEYILVYHSKSETEYDEYNRVT